MLSLAATAFISSIAFEIKCIFITHLLWANKIDLLPDYMLLTITLLFTEEISYSRHFSYSSYFHMIHSIVSTIPEHRE